MERLAHINLSLQFHWYPFIFCSFAFPNKVHVIVIGPKMDTVLLMKSFHIRRSLFLITGSHHNPHDFRDYSSLVHQLPIKIFLLNSQKSGQMRQSNLPPLLHPPKVGGLLSRNLACKCSCNFTKICFPICFVFLHKICFPICFCISPQARQAALQPHQYFSWEIAYLFVSICHIFLQISSPPSLSHRIIVQ